MLSEVGVPARASVAAREQALIRGPAGLLLRCAHGVSGSRIHSASLRVPRHGVYVAGQTQRARRGGLVCCRLCAERSLETLRACASAVGLRPAALTHRARMGRVLVLASPATCSFSCAHARVGWLTLSPRCGSVFFMPADCAQSAKTAEKKTPRTDSRPSEKQVRTDRFG